MKFKPNDMISSKTPTQLPNGDWLLVLESHGDDDSYSTSVWSHYHGYDEDFEFGKNITIVGAVKILNACAVVVRKIDPKITESFYINDPEDGEIEVEF